VKVSVRLFAAARELAGTERVTLELSPGTTVEGLKEHLGETLPQLVPLLPQLLVAINGVYAVPEMLIPENAEVACFPPVSGG
jgi:molybdopterin synthase sulfur carrier subunit